MDVVVVESPAKAKTINRYLGSGYNVLASYGHIRDLPAKDGSVRPDEDFSMSWVADPKAEKQIREIAKAVKGADRLILATDPDREGEAISWHVQAVLQERKALRDVEVKRVVFHEITKGAVLDAMEHPRDVDHALVDAYLARRALDYLVGFTLSPVLWRKLPGSRSAGRVQSVALRLVCEREAEIEAFRAEEYWSVETTFLTPEKKPFTARLTHLDGKRLDKLGLKSEADAKAAVAAIEAGVQSVAGIDRRRVKRNPQPPFTTSTLQQEASRKLGFGASRTMQIAQRLYEGVDIGGETVGLITYMRTDGVQLSGEAVGQIRAAIGREHGDRYLPNAPRMYKSKAKNAQEAHEAIRPTDVFRRPSDMRRILDPDMARLYELIWKRAVASQMASAELDQTTVTIRDGGGKAELRATGSIVAFDGFLALYVEDKDDAEADGEDGRLLPPMKERDALERTGIKPEQHFTQPPPRYSEASLVKKLEELGIGRPSTYASILQVLQDRDYVRLDKRRFIPSDRGRLVTSFLSNFFARYVEYSFTADLERELDEISDGKLDWKEVLRRFWGTFSGSVDETKDLTITQVLDAVDADLGRHFFKTDENGEPIRTCPSCDGGRLGLKLGRYGGFIGCSNYPECKYTKQLADAVHEKTGEGEPAPSNEPKVLGTDPETGKPVTLRRGPYGHYVQLGEAGDDGPKSKPKRTSIPAKLDPADVTFDIALGLLALPRPVGPDPETGDMISAGIGRFGPYLKLGTTYKSIPAADGPLEVLSIGLNRAVTLLAEKKGSRAAAKTLGEKKGKPVTLHSGRYGPYVQLGTVRATLPKGEEAEGLTLERAIELIDAKAAKGGGAKKTAATKTTTKKTAAKKKTPAKKAAPKKTAAKKTAAANAKPAPDLDAADD